MAPIRHDWVPRAHVEPLRLHTSMISSTSGLDEENLVLDETNHAKIEKIL